MAIASAVVLTAAAGGVVAFADGSTAAGNAAHAQTVMDTKIGSASAADAPRDSTAASKAAPLAVQLDHRRQQSAIKAREEAERIAAVEAAKAAAAKKAAAEKAAREKAAKKAAAEKAAREKAARAAAAAKKAEKKAAAQREARARVSRDSARAALTSPSAARSLGRSMAAAMGWGSGQFQCLDVLWTHESGWNARASNPSSGAYGIPQALPGSKMGAYGGDWRTNARTQIEWGLHYIRSSYGTPCGAWNHWQNNHWY
ncbi:MAG: hypothetical protein ACTHK1_10595 [Actinomycetales bacterium]